MLQKIKKVINVIDMSCFGISMVGLAALSFAAVIFRFCFNNPIIWIEEVQMILVVWSVFFGASIAIREKEHMAAIHRHRIGVQFTPLFPVVIEFRKQVADT